jgi:hypothetical protein
MRHIIMYIEGTIAFQLNILIFRIPITWSCPKYIPKTFQQGINMQKHAILVPPPNPYHHVLYRENE